MRRREASISPSFRELWQRDASRAGREWLACLDALAAAVGAAPKADLHVHLEGAVCPYRRQRIRGPGGCCGGQPGSYEDLARQFTHHLKWFRGYTQYRDAVIRFGESCYLEGVVYAEVSVSPIGPLLSGVRVLDIFHGLADGAQFVRDRWQVEIRFEVEFYRGAPIDVVLMMTDAAAPFAGHTIVALGTAGSEGRMSLLPYLNAFEAAHSIGLLVTPHAGEMCGPESVWDALEVRPDRIKHGGSSLLDNALCERLFKSSVALDMSVLSNIRLGYATSLKTHPFRELTRRGITCGVGADDPAILGTTIIDEYVSAAILGADPRALAEGSVAVSGLDQVTGGAMRHRISGFDWSACDAALNRLALLREAADRGHCGARPKM